MKTIFKTVLTIIVFINNANAQDITLDYYPQKNNTITVKDYLKGIEDLDYAYKDIKRRASKNQSLDYVDYWRVAIAYIYLEMDKETVYNLFLKSKENNKKGFCIILNFQLEQSKNDIEDTRLYKFLGQENLNNLLDCSGIDIQTVKNKNSNKLPFKKQGHHLKWIKKSVFPNVRWYSKSQKKKNYSVWPKNKLSLKDNN